MGSVGSFLLFYSPRNETFISTVGANIFCLSSQTYMLRADKNDKERFANLFPSQIYCSCLGHRDDARPTLCSHFAWDRTRPKSGSTFADISKIISIPARVGPHLLGRQHMGGVYFCGQVYTLCSREGWLCIIDPSTRRTAIALCNSFADRIAPGNAAMLEGGHGHAPGRYVA